MRNGKMGKNELHNERKEVGTLAYNYNNI